MSVGVLGNHTIVSSHRIVRVLHQSSKPLTVKQLQTDLSGEGWVEPQKLYMMVRRGILSRTKSLSTDAGTQWKKKPVWHYWLPTATARKVEGVQPVPEWERLGQVPLTDEQFLLEAYYCREYRNIY